ncbi:hypothetical protein KUTeg_001820 [Tegillarca granosa]|uniref:DNA-directed RNA polymerase n=1 Tax=Tegillarca granosa TaxID=220873 RepID=A0ABQ9FWY5_TEGGR|nr:hypothetical protein KUTeg_001820 [Tegillarca granosa]
MMIESMAGKSGALHGFCHDATPFTFSEEEPAIDHFGEMLTRDPLSLQVRTTGPIDQLTHQPVKGRKRAGGIRFGEMERDALIAHGTSFLLQDRLLNCSDRSMVCYLCIIRAHICTNCGSILSPVLEKPPSATAAVSSESRRKWTCITCKRTDCISIITVPYVFRYLIAELAAMNINVEMKIK